MSLFVKQRDDGRFQLDKPEGFEDELMIDDAIKQFRSRGCNLGTMGRSPGAYDALRSNLAQLIRLMDRGLLRR